MANLVITSTGSTIAVDFGAYSTQAGATVGTWPKSGIQSVQIYEGGAYVYVRMGGGQEWHISHAANSYNALIVDSVDGAAPSSNADLYAKIAALFP